MRRKKMLRHIRVIGMNRLRMKEKASEKRRENVPSHQSHRHEQTSERICVVSSLRSLMVSVDVKQRE